MDKRHDELNEAYWSSREKVARFQETHDLLRHSKVEANKDAIARRSASLNRIRAILEQMKERETQAATALKEYADQNNPENAQMFLDAYNEHFERLAAQGPVPDEQITAVVERIDSLERLLKSQKLRQEVEQHQIPAEVLSRVKGEDLERVKRIFVELVTQRIADLKGMIPQEGFKSEQLNVFWRQALVEFQSADQLEPKEPKRNFNPHRISSPTRKIRAPGWTGEFKRRRVGGRKAGEI